MLTAAISSFASHPPDDKMVQTRQPTSRRGNIHTGATPPWLQGDDDDDDSDDDVGGDGEVESKGRRGSGSQTVLIGPSDAEFNKHSMLFPLP